MNFCPKCNNTLYEQYGNGKTSIICTKCKWKQVIHEDRAEQPVSTRVHLPKPEKRKFLDDIDYAEMTKQSPKCDVIYEKKYPKQNPIFSQKSIDELISNDILREAVNSEVEKLYSFQAESFERIINGENIVITAPTASGKTQAFLMPILQKILENPLKNKASALFIYPTKALAADQTENIQNLSEKCKISIRQLDGDSRTNTAYRNNIVANPPDILTTNFDMISWHLSRTKINEFSQMFVAALENLKFVVVDEAHQCTGFYGSNIAWILKRLQRLNPKIQFIAASATLDNPENFCSKLFPVPMKHIEGIGSRGKITLQFLRPKTSALDLMIDITRQFGLGDRQVLAFSKSRRDAELLAIDGSDSRLNIEIHRSGISPQRRRLIESALRKNEIKAVSCTPTLELGINIGNLDGIVSAFTSHGRLVQRIGRAGRRGQDAHAYMVLDDKDPISKFYIDNPDQYFKDKKFHEINFENPLVDENQILLMAKDRPISKDEFPKYSAVIAKLLSEGVLIEIGARYHCSDAGWNRVKSWGIRDMGDSIQLHGNNRRLGKVERQLGFNWVYPGAIYFHDKKTYRSVSFVNSRRYSRAFLQQERTANQTFPLKSKLATIKEELIIKSHKSINVKYCSLKISEHISKYVEKNRKGSFEKGTTYNVRPPVTLLIDTLGILLQFDTKSSTTKISDSYLAETDDSLHALKHLLIHAAKMLIGSENSEIDGMVDPHYKTILLYDNSMNQGNGVSKAIYEKLELILQRALDIVIQCNCKDAHGCPLCTHWEGCSKLNHGLSKQGAKTLLESLVDKSL